VKFIGRVSEELMLEEYQSAHLMVATSLNEGMSISAMEALSAGVYLIATRASGFEDMISEDKNGDFIPFRNPAELEKRIRRYYGNLQDGKLRYDTTKASVNISDWKEISFQYQNLFFTFLK
jgi:glycosyltransferase involved in cell wall biosynthesis